jgi:hypothetical protein
MKHIAALGSLAAVLICLGATGSQNPPVIDAGALNAFSHGPGSIAATIKRYDRDADLRAFCAPDVPYFEWYVAQRGLPTSVKLDARVKPFVREPSIEIVRTIDPNVGLELQGRFTCSDLAPGAYLVWLEGAVPQGGSIAPQSAPGPRPPVQNNVGEPEDRFPPNYSGTMGPPGFLQTFYGGTPHMIPVRGAPVHVTATSGSVTAQLVAY